MKLHPSTANGTENSKTHTDLVTTEQQLVRFSKEFAQIYNLKFRYLLRSREIHHINAFGVILFLRETLLEYRVHLLTKVTT